MIMEELTPERVKELLTNGLGITPLSPEDSYRLGRSLISAALAAGYKVKR